MVAAVYSAGSLPATARRAVMDSIRKGMRWNGAGGDRALFAHLSGVGSTGLDPTVYSEPVVWALRTLGLEVQRNGSVHRPERAVVQRHFRIALRGAHPDHGGDSNDAAQRIGELAEARRILLS